MKTGDDCVAMCSNVQWLMCKTGRMWLGGNATVTQRPKDPKMMTMNSLCVLVVIRSTKKSDGDAPNLVRKKHYPIITWAVLKTGHMVVWYCVYRLPIFPMPKCRWSRSTPSESDWHGFPLNDPYPVFDSNPRNYMILHVIIYSYWLILLESTRWKQAT